MAPRGGGWSPAAGRQAVRRAEQYLGWMYAWAGGNAYGPTYGVCAGDGAYNDCHIRGFDCSGLTIYGWAPYLYMAHYAATQYWQAGSFHPSTSNLMPGDLVFWSSNGTIGGIHHVAMYIGGGNVIQAPQSGSVIQITPLWDVSWGYFGATRPLT
jgi:cell wall-associated NlpC family hydrolase